MKAQVFLEWMDAADLRFAADIVRTTGINRVTAQKMLADAKAGKDVEIKQTVALAMSAVAAGLEPWKGNENE